MPAPSADTKARFNTLIPASTSRNTRPRSAVVTKPTPSSSHVKSRKSSSTQTGGTVFIKDDLNFLSETSKVIDENGMREDYAKAVNFINTCHKFVNSLMENRNNDASTGDKSKFHLPKVTNFVPIFSWLIGQQNNQQDQQDQQQQKQEQQKPQQKPHQEQQKVEEKHSAVIKPKRIRNRMHEEKPVQKIEEPYSAAQMEKDFKDMLQGHLGEFLNNIQANLTTIVLDNTKAKMEKDVSKAKSRMVTTIQSFEYRSKSPVGLEPPVPAIPLPPPPTEGIIREIEPPAPEFPDFSEDTAMVPFTSPALLCNNSSSSSLSCSLSNSQLSDSSDIKSDAEIRDELTDG